MCRELELEDGLALGENSRKDLRHYASIASSIFCDRWFEGSEVWVQLWKETYSRWIRTTPHLKMECHNRSEKQYTTSPGAPLYHPLLIQGSWIGG